MPSTFLDGPAAGVGLSLRRAPLFLRLVRAAGKWDALDQLDDEPRDDEEIFVYQATTKPSVVFVRPGGRYEWAVYRHVDVDAEALGLGDTPTWRAWVDACAEEIVNG